MEIFNSVELLNHTIQHLSVSVGLWVLVILAILLDLWDGVSTAKKLHKPIHSHKLRVTVDKISEYWRIMLIGFIIDTIGILIPWWILPYVSIALCVGLICIEAKSMFEHAKRRKSSTIELQDILRMAIDCGTEADARSVLKKFGEYLDSNKKYSKNENSD